MQGPEDESGKFWQGPGKESTVFATVSALQTSNICYLEINSPMFVARVIDLFRMTTNSYLSSI